MRFGTAIKDRKPSGGGGNSRYISWLKEGDNVLRFLEEYPVWTEYWQHFDRERRRGYPCNNEDRANCPGCIEKDEDAKQAEIEDRAPRIWGAQKFALVNVLTEQGYVNLYQIPARILSSIERQYTKYDTITDREYTIVKYKGDDGNWKYDLERGDHDTLDLSPYKERMIDHGAALETAYNEVFGPGTEDAKPKKAAPAEDKPKGVRGEHAALRLDPEKSAGPDTMRSTGWTDQKSMDEPPTEPAGAAEPDQAQDEDEITLDEADLRKMTWKELIGLIAQCELPIPETREPNELADYLIEKLNA